MATTNLIQLTSQGLVVPSFTEIRDAIIDCYQEAYGSDIDLSTGSADGAFVNNLALMMRSLTESIRALYSNLDIRTASGIYLDALCALSNVRRKEATRSNAYLTITNIGNANVVIDSTTKFISADNLTWTPRDTTTIIPTGTAVVQVFCDTLGANEEPANSINKCVEVLPITIVQSNAANVGLDTESDEELRARRLQSNSAAGITVLESLVGALVNIAGIDDASVYNNPGASGPSAKDGTGLEAHSIYTIIRKHPGIDVSDEMIGKTIYNKLTPGIATTESNGTSGTAKSYTVLAEMLGVTLTNANQTVYWKEASGITPTFVVQIECYDNFTDPTDTNHGTNLSEYTAICNSVINWANSLPLGSSPTKDDITQQFMSADPKKFGRRTFQVYSITSGAGTILSSNPDAFYNYTSYAVTGTSNPYVHVITFS